MRGKATKILNSNEHLNDMKNLYKAALLAALGITAVSAQAQIANNDLVLGFTSQAAGVTSDYVLDLGQIPTTANTQLSGISLSTFNSVFGSALSGGQVNVGIVGGTDSGTFDAITSTLDNGSGTATVAGSNAPKTATGKSQLSGAADSADGLALGVVSQGDLSSFSQNIAINPTTAGAAANSFAGYLGSNPLSTISSGETITLDLWKSTQSGKSGATAWVYEGDVALDLTGSTLSAVFDPTVVSVPEPTTYGLLAGAGLLVVALRRNINPKNA